MLVFQRPPKKVQPEEGKQEGRVRATLSGPR